MKKLRLFVLSVAVLTGLIFSLAYGYIYFFAKDQITSFLKNTIDEQITVEEMAYAFPFGLTLKNVQLPQNGSIKEARIFISPLSFFSIQYQISSVELIRPEIIFSGPPSPGKNIFSQTSPSQTSPRSTSSTTILIHKINIQDGRATYQQHTLGDIQGHLDHVLLPDLNQEIDFTLLGQMSLLKLSVLTQIHGWIDWPKKNMHAKLILKEEGLSDEISADLEAENNLLNVKGIAKVSTPMNKALMNSILLQSTLKNVAEGEDTQTLTHFTFQTQLDHPQVERVQFKGEWSTRP